MTIRVTKGGSGREPASPVTKELVNELLIWIQSNGFVVKDRPHIYQDGTWLVRFFSQILDPIKPIEVLEHKEIVGIEKPKIGFKDRIRILFGKEVRLPRANFIWKTTSQEVANQRTVMRGLFYIRSLPKPHIELHIETVPVRESYTPQQRKVLDAALHNVIKNWEAATARAIRAGLKILPVKPTIENLQPNSSSIKVDWKLNIPLSGIDSLKDFKDAIGAWL